VRRCCQDLRRGPFLGLGRARASNAYNTLLLVTFDEHGGTYDHVPPPAVPPPDLAAPAGQMASGSTAPACACRPSRSRPGSGSRRDQRGVPAHVGHPDLRERWQLGAPLTGRDAVARDLAPVLALDQPRDPAGWPSAIPQPVPPFLPARVSLESA